MTKFNWDNHMTTAEALEAAHQEAHGCRDPRLRAYWQGVAKGLSMFINPIAHGYVKRDELLKRPEYLEARQ